MGGYEAARMATATDKAATTRPCAACGRPGAPLYDNDGVALCSAPVVVEEASVAGIVDADAFRNGVGDGKLSCAGVAKLRVKDDAAARVSVLRS